MKRRQKPAETAEIDPSGHRAALVRCKIKISALRTARSEEVLIRGVAKIKRATLPVQGRNPELR
jgi:hypothetical protein